MPSVFLCAAKCWREDRVPRLSASLTFYAIFALAPFFLLSLLIVSAILGGETARLSLMQPVYDLLGYARAEYWLDSISPEASSQGIIEAIVAFTTMVVGAMGLFAHLREALNTIFGQKEDAPRGWRAWVRDSLFSFLLVILSGWFIVLSLIASTIFSYLFSGVLEQLNTAISFLFFSLIIALLFRYVPSKRLPWRAIWPGAFLTAVLLLVFKLTMGYLIGQSATASVHGAASAVLLFMLWMYYSSQVFLFGAEWINCRAEVLGKGSG